MSVNDKVAPAILDAQKPAFWVPKLSPKQLLVFNDFHRYLLLSGPRKSSKSWASVNKILRHAVDVPNAEIIMVSRNIKTAKEGGIWSYLIDAVLEPEWIKSGVTKYIKPPGQDGQTRTLYCTLQNRYGGASKIMLNSLDYDDDVERLFKERAASMIYFSELSKWRKRKVFDVSVMSLRKPGVPYHMMQWLADTNPGDDGEDEWYYQLFEIERRMEGVPEYCKTEADIARFRKRQNELNLIHIFLNENPFLSQDEIDDVISTHISDPDLYARYVEGRYVKTSGEGFFANVFKPDIHVLGNCRVPNRAEWETLSVPPQAREIDVGVDLGDKNSAVEFVYRFTDEHKRNEYYVVAEVIVENDSVTLEALTKAILDTMDELEQQAGHELHFSFWSDTSSFNRKLSARDTEAMLVHNLSGGRITLSPVLKYSGSVPDGVTMMRRLLFEKRLFFSAHCFHIVTSMRALKPERSRGTGVQKVPDNVHTHPWDALRYALMSREPRDAAIRRPRIQRVPHRIVSLA